MPLSPICPWPPRPPPPSASSFPEHPIAQLLRQLQCAVYARLYPAVSQGTTDAAPASPTGLSFLSLDAGGSLPAEPGGRRLRASRSLHCMFSVPEHGPAGLRHSLSSTPLADGGPGTPKVESGWPGPAAAPQTPRESSFEDLERFLASPESWAPGEPPAGSKQEAALPEQLKGIVRDIHNAIGEGPPLGLRDPQGLSGGGGEPLHLVVLARVDLGCRVERTGRGGLAGACRACCVTRPFPDRLLSLTLLAFEGLNTAAGKDQCLACLEEAFFPPLWAPLLALYRYRGPRTGLGPPLAPLVPSLAAPCLSARRSVHQPREAALARSMERHRHAGPADMGLSSRLFPTAPGCPAYGSAVKDLRLIPLETCPRRKLECIGAGPRGSMLVQGAGGPGGCRGDPQLPLRATVRALRGICECAEEYCGSRDSRTPASAAM